MNIEILRTASRGRQRDLTAAVAVESYLRNRLAEAKSAAQAASKASEDADLELFMAWVYTSEELVAALKAAEKHHGDPREAQFREPTIFVSAHDWAGGAINQSAYPHGPIFKAVHVGLFSKLPYEGHPIQDMNDPRWGTTWEDLSSRVFGPAAESCRVGGNYIYHEYREGGMAW